MKTILLFLLFAQMANAPTLLRCGVDRTDRLLTIAQQLVEADKRLKAQPAKGMSEVNLIVTRWENERRGCAERVVTE